MTVGDVRTEVALRDVGCVAPRIDPDCGPCRDRWGNEMSNAPTFLALDDGEMDYVRYGATGPRHKLASDHVWICPGHHRWAVAGSVWATSHRHDERAYLDRLAKAAA